MACRPKYWLYGLLPLALLGGAAYYMQRDSVEADLLKRGTAVVKAGEGAFSDGKAWGSLAINGRDATLSGTAPSQKAVDTLKAKLDSTNGIRLVDATSNLLPEAKPFKWSLAKAGSAFALAGMVGAEGERAKIEAAIASANPNTRIADTMTLVRGAPACALTGAAAAATHLGKLLDGEASLTDCALSIKGAAASQEIKAQVEGALKALGGGLTLGSVNISAPVPPPPPPPPVVAPPPAPVVVVPPAVIPVVVPLPPAPPVVINLPVVAAPAPVVAPPPPVVVAPPPPAPVVNYAELCNGFINNARSKSWPQFDTNLAVINNDSKTVLGFIATAMRLCHSSVKFELSGHTDSRASSAYNADLSTRRVNSVIEFFTKANFDKARFSAAIAKGETVPVAPNSSAQNMQLNRRVEIIAK